MNAQDIEIYCEALRNESVNLDWESNLTISVIRTSLYRKESNIKNRKIGFVRYSSRKRGLIRKEKVIIYTYTLINLSQQLNVFDFSALGFTILPLNWHIDIFGQDYNSWRIYLLICSIPPVVGFVTATMLPESPKYLMAIGRSDAALKLFRRMYCMNTRQPSETFPVSRVTRNSVFISRLFRILLFINYFWTKYI